MILQRLVEFARRVEDELPPPMYDSQPHRWQIELDESGACLGVTRLTDGTKKDRGLERTSPYLKRSGTAPPPQLLTDKANYVLGFGAARPSESWHFRQYRDLVRKCAESTGEQAVQAACAFLDDQTSAPIPCPEGMEVGDLVCFRVGGVLPTDLPAVGEFWATRREEGDAKIMQCLVCGQVGPVDRVSPVAIKGLARVGGQSSGMAVVSANHDAFLSYGAKQSFVAPTCRACGIAYANALNYMLENARYSMFVGPSAFAFWCSEDLGFSISSLISQPTEDDVRALLGSPWTGQPGGAIDESRFYALSLSASAARVVIRDWVDTTLPNAQSNISRWFRLHKLVDTDGSEGRPLGIYALAASPYMKADQMPAEIPRSLVRCAVQGGMLPTSLMAHAVKRNIAERSVTRNRAALIKAVLVSQLTTIPKESYMEKLDTGCTTPGYLCGRLLAEMEQAQKMAVRPKATLVDRYYGAASSSPGAVFGTLLRNLQSHMAKLRKERPGAHVRIDERIQEIMSQLGEFPKTLNLKEQALFSLGYYHQKAANRAAAIAYANGNNAEEGEAE